MLKKIISGAQTGADRAGLDAAKAAGLATGGTMPKGFKAQDGRHPEFAELYGIEEDESPLYPPRTEKNVRNADATIRFATNFKSPGELLTRKCIDKHKKPYFDVNLNDPFTVKERMILTSFLTDNGFETVNVAGNSESSSPGIQRIVELILTDVLKTVVEKQNGKRVSTSDGNDQPS